MKTTPEQLRKLRERSGLTQDEAAALVYADGGKATWSRWERGVRKFSEAVPHLFALRTGQRYPVRGGR